MVGIGTHEYWSDIYIGRLEKTVNTCDKNAIKLTANAVGHTSMAFANEQINGEEHEKRIAKINELTTKFIDSCVCRV